MAEIAPRQPLFDLGLHFFVAQSPAKLQIHHPQVNPSRGGGPAHARVEEFFEWLEQLALAQKLVYFLKLLVQPIQTWIDEAVAKTQLLRYRFAHNLFYITQIISAKYFLTFSVRTN